MTDQYTKRFLDHLEKRMSLVVIELENIAKQKVNIGNVGGKTPSAPGEPPRKVTGELGSKIHGFVERNQKGVRGFLGAFVKYARRLEFGFVGRQLVGKYRVPALINQQPRPFLRPTIYENKAKILTILTKGG